jgi:hypothetical protein
VYSRKQELPAVPIIIHVGAPRAQSGGQPKSLVQGVCVCVCVLCLSPKAWFKVSVSVSVSLSVSVSVCAPRVQSLEAGSKDWFKVSLSLSLALSLCLSLALSLYVCVCMYEDAPTHSLSRPTLQAGSRYVLCVCGWVGGWVGVLMCMCTRVYKFCTRTYTHTPVCVRAHTHTHGRTLYDSSCAYAPTIISWLV